LRVLSALLDDLNTSEAFAIIDEAIRNDQLPEDRFTIYRIMRLLGLRTRKSRISKLAESFQKRAQEVESLTLNEQSNLLPVRALALPTNQQNEAYVEIAGSLSALAEFRQENNFDSVRLTQLSDDLRSIESSAARQRKLGPEGVASKLGDLAGQLGAFTSNDWNNVTKTAIERPIFRSGKPKPETIFFYYMGKLNRFAQETNLDQLFSPDQLLRVKTEFLRKARPAHSDFETRVRRLVSNRNEARRAKNFIEADRIRRELEEMGVVLKDSKDGTTWEIAR
jgi:cysteinyl-tRNA synthetase